MTRIEKIRKMTIEEMAKEIYAKAVDYCDYCANNEYDCTDKSCEEGIKQWLESEVELNADEMFKELGYGKTSDRLEGVEYTKIEDGTQIILIIKGKNGNCGYARYSNNLIETDCGKWTRSNYAFITEAEDKAIQKKLEELKSLKEGNKEYANNKM